MVDSSNKKNKIELTSYNYKRDIENRIYMSQFSVFDVDILIEILNSSLKICTRNLAEYLNITEETLRPSLEKLSQTKLFKIEGINLVVDKEMRKYYESQITKFDDDFEPGVDYLQGILSKVPIHVLPVWYAIPRSSDHIFNSIIEKNILSPKIYERYISELNFIDPVMTGIMQDVFSAPDYKIRSRTLRDKYNLTREQFEECMLYLEFNFVCCLSYNRIDGMWKEVVTPFYEWREYLRFQRDTQPKRITDIETIKRKHPHDFGFIQDMSALLKVAAQVPLALKKDGGLDADAINSWLPGRDEGVVKNLIELLIHLNLAKSTKGTLQPAEKAKEWVKKSLQDQAITIYRQTSSYYRNKLGEALDDRDIREAEKGLRRVINKGWIYFEDFMRGFISPIGTAEPVMLKNKGKRWNYALPNYSVNERNIVEMTIFERLFQVGMIAVGTHEGKPCFCVTAFGSIALGE